MEYYSAIKKNTFESVLMRLMKLEPIIQSEVSQKEKQGVGAIITDRYAHQSIKCQYKSQFLVAEGKCMTCYYKNVWNAITL